MTTPPPCRSDLQLVHNLIHQWQGDGTGKASSSEKAPLVSQLIPRAMLKKIYGIPRRPLWLRNSDFR
jgi:hypothetical protein